MKTQNNRMEAAKNYAKKEYTKPVFNKFGRVADLTTGGSKNGKEPTSMKGTML